MSATDILTRVARHGEAIRGLEKRQNRQDEEIGGVRDEVKDLREMMHSRFNRQDWFLIATLAGIVADVIGRHL